MIPRRPEQVRDLLIREGWNQSVAFYHMAKDGRNLKAALIRGALPLLRDHPEAGKDVRTLVHAVTPEEPDEVVEAQWRSTFDALRALFRTSPIGSQRERETLLSIARDKNIVRAMVAAAVAEPKIDPSWIAVLSAEGSKESSAIVQRELAKLSRPALVAALRSFEGALSPTPVEARSEDQARLPIPLGGTRLTSDQFWMLIDKASETIDPVGTLGEWLRSLKPPQIAAFDRHFDAAMEKANRPELWNAVDLKLDGCSDDGFQDFRAELILKGRRVFELILEDPDALADYPEIEGDETIAGLAAEVYEEKTGREIPSKRA